MSFVVQWVMQVIVFILIATIIELITPENKMKKYVNLVVGLILILIFAQPILYFLKIDIPTELSQFEATIFDDENQLKISESLFESQKEDIQAEQDAYILLKVEEQLINEANPILFEKFNVTISRLEFIFSNEKMDKYDDLKEVIAFIQKKDYTQSGIDPVVIELDRNDQNLFNFKKIEKKIKKELQEIWGLHDKKITIEQEGGTS